MNSLPQQVAARILAEYIQNGQVAIGERLPSVRELETHFHVSRTTIAHALGLLAEQGHVQRRVGSGCYVSDHVAPRSNGAPPMVGYIAPSKSWELFTAVYEGIEKVCQARGRHVLVANAEYSYDLERQQVERMIDGGCEAIVMMPASRTEEQYKIDYLRREFLDFPIVLVDIADPEQRRSCVLFDNYRLGCEYTSRLLAEGHRRIAFMDISALDQPLVHCSTRERRRGFIETLAQEEVPTYEEDIWTIVDPRPDSDLSAEFNVYLDRIESQDEPVTAVIALHDLLAAGFIDTAMARGIRVPEDIRVVGFDNLTAIRHFRPEFPTTTPSFREAGEAAARIAFQYIDGSLKDRLIYMMPVPIRWRGGKWAGKGSTNPHPSVCMRTPDCVE